MSENKVTFGLENVHYATYTEANGTITYDTPIPIPGGVELTLDPRGELTELYADNILYYVAKSNQGYDGTLSIANIPEEFAIDCLGEIKDETDGVISEVADAKTKPFALLFEFDGDIKAVRHVLFNCTANRPSDKSSTKTNSSDPNTKELKFVASPRTTDKHVKTKTSSTTKQEVYDAWYDEVYEKADVA
ncbi:major tail protein [Cytobacillus sp. IB215316]|uniref:major tail protein n=1 Tax=Cytobacillus sp. IB215316 TaxID=3097354 RepID=UPI002A12E64C|nr:major tail protein [Cytobacillus sp. IB215316]MDX8359826.1 major tail protein [Cytobacillus sp. IB215316]